MANAVCLKHISALISGLFEREHNGDVFFDLHKKYREEVTAIAAIAIAAPTSTPHLTTTPTSTPPLTTTPTPTLPLATPTPRRWARCSARRWRAASRYGVTVGPSHPIRPYP